MPYPYPKYQISRAEIFRLRRAGHSISDIAERAGLGRETVAGLCRKEGVHPPEPLRTKRRLRHPLAPTHEELARLYWEEGMSQEDIANHIGVDRSRISYWMNHYGIMRRTRSVQIKAGIEKHARPNPVGFTSETARAASLARWAKQRSKNP